MPIEAQTDQGAKQTGLETFSESGSLHFGLHPEDIGNGTYNGNHQQGWFEEEQVALRPQAGGSGLTSAAEFMNAVFQPDQRGREHNQPGWAELALDNSMMNISGTEEQGRHKCEERVGNEDLHCRAGRAR
jgi:hypothetical protein